MAINLNEVVGINLQENSIVTKSFKISNSSGEILVPETQFDTYVFESKDEYTESELIAIIEHNDLDKLAPGVRIVDVTLSAGTPFYRENMIPRYVNLLVLHNDGYEDWGYTSNGEVLFITEAPSEVLIPFGPTDDYAQSHLAIQCSNFLVGLTNLREHSVPYLYNSNGHRYGSACFSLSESEVTGGDSPSGIMEGNQFQLFMYDPSAIVPSAEQTQFYWTRTKSRTPGAARAVTVHPTIGSIIVTDVLVTQENMCGFRPCIALMSR